MRLSFKLGVYISAFALTRTLRLFSLTASQIKNCELAIAQFKTTFGIQELILRPQKPPNTPPGLDSDQFHYTGSSERLETVHP